MKSKNTKAGAAVMTVIFLLGTPFVSGAQQKDYMDSLWNAANAAYAEGRWADAVSDYTMISDAGLESASLYCNTGNAYFKDGNVPMAILYYERALKLDPSYADARFNLDLLNSGIQDRIDPVPELILKTWARNICYMMDSNAWAVMTIVLFAVFCGLLLLFLSGRGIAARRAGFFGGIAVLLLCMASMSFATWQKRDYMRADEAVIMRPVASVKSSPSSEASTDLFVLHEGTKVKVIDQVGAWSNIELADGRQGWMQSDAMELI